MAGLTLWRQNDAGCQWHIHFRNFIQRGDIGPINFRNDTIQALSIQVESISPYSMEEEAEQATNMSAAVDAGYTFKWQQAT